MVNVGFLIVDFEKRRFVMLPILLMILLQRGFQGGEQNYTRNKVIKPVDSKEFF